MNNGRDCEHGQLARSCDRCADAAEIAELRKDAERYRRLRDGQNWPAVFGGHDEPEPLRGAHLDAAIDAELALHNVIWANPPQGEKLA